jgi:hypothetical protein
VVAALMVQYVPGQWTISFSESISNQSSNGSLGFNCQFKIYERAVFVSQHLVVKRFDCSVVMGNRGEQPEPTSASQITKRSDSTRLRAALSEHCASSANKHQRTKLTCWVYRCTGQSNDRQKYTDSSYTHTVILHNLET